MLCVQTDSRGLLRAACNGCCHLLDVKKSVMICHLGNAVICRFAFQHLCTVGVMATGMLLLHASGTCTTYADVLSDVSD